MAIENLAQEEPTQLDPLSVVPTPIGNLGDITLRAIQVLNEADLLLCEDTRRTRKLLSHLSIPRKSLLALHEHNEERLLAHLVERLENGETMALLSDAGTPCLSDPGYRLLRAVRERGIRYTVLPGANAITTALVASGLPPIPFRFGGFLSPKKNRRRQEFETALTRNETALYFESPHRLVTSLEILAALAPSLRCCVVRELTKKFETVHSGTSTELQAYFQNHPPKGEIVLLFNSGAKTPKLKEH